MEWGSFFFLIFSRAQRGKPGWSSSPGARHVLRDGAAAPLSQHRPGHLQPVPHPPREGFCVPRSLAGNGRGARQALVPLCCVGWAQGLRWGWLRLGQLRGARDAPRKTRVLERQVGLPGAQEQFPCWSLTLPGALQLSLSELIQGSPIFGGQENLAVAVPAWFP